MSNILICPHCSSDLTPEDFAVGMCPYCGTRLMSFEPAQNGESAEDKSHHVQETVVTAPEIVRWKVDGDWVVCPRCGQSYDIADKPEYCERCMPDPDRATFRYVYPETDRSYIVLKHIEHNWEIRCGPGHTILGRHVTPGLDENRYVGRRHARITCTDSCCTVCDLGSVNGTRLNGRALQPYEETELRAGDILELDIERFTVS